MSKTFNGRIVHKHDIEYNWMQATNFTPIQGELIIYDSEVDADGNNLDLPEGRTEPYTYERFKIGDGITNVNALPFTTNIYVQSTAPTNATFGALWIDTSETSYLSAEGVEF